MPPLLPTSPSAEATAILPKIDPTIQQLKTSQINMEKVIIEYVTNKDEDINPNVSVHDCREGYGYD